MSFVYIIQNTSTNIYKIGVSDNVDMRIKNLQTANGFPLLIIDKFICNNAFNMENQIHKLLKEYKLTGEWFILTQEDLDNVRKMIKELIIQDEKNIPTKNKPVENKQKNTVKYECIPCEYSTNIKSHYDRHMKSEKHTNEDIKFDCKYCNSIFIRSSNLSKHIDTCSEKNNYPHKLENQIKH
jgi:hypothetical protein